MVKLPYKNKKNMCDIRYVCMVNLLLHTRNLSLFIDEHQRKPKVQSKMGKPETQTTKTNKTRDTDNEDK